jgi:glyoxylase-like metal-dependent hydrolase (beta-lactamase superfamily II)
MRSIIMPVTPFQQNCSLHWCAETREAVLVDPGGEADYILENVAEQGVNLVKILLTHGHLDHVGATLELAQRLEIPVIGPQRQDEFWLDLLPTQCEKFGFPPTEAFLPDAWLEDGDTVTFGREVLEVLHCPGHTPGHVVFFNPAESLAIVGDVLFRGSIGRTDFPRGDHATLIDSIRSKLWPLGDEVRFIPGHGPMSSFGEERRSNPFVGDRPQRV